MERYLKETRLLDFSHPLLTGLVKSRGWAELSEYERIACTYDVGNAGRPESAG